MNSPHWEYLKLLISQTSVRLSYIPGTMLGAKNTHVRATYLTSSSLSGPHGWYLAEKKSMFY